MFVSVLFGLVIALSGESIMEPVFLKVSPFVNLVQLD